MIKKFEVEDIVKIMQLEHTGENTAPLPCEKGEWVQWLVTQVDNPKLNIVGEIQEGKIKGYEVLINNVLPPVFYSCSLLYLWSPVDHRITHALVEAALEWKYEIGAKEGLAVMPLTHSEKYMESFGGILFAKIYRF